MCKKKRLKIKVKKEKAPRPNSISEFDNFENQCLPRTRNNQSELINYDPRSDQIYVTFSFS